MAEIPEVTITRTEGLYSVGEDITEPPVFESRDLFELLGRLTANGPVLIRDAYDTEGGE